MSQRWIKGFALVTGGLAGSTLAAVAVGNLLWKRATKNAVRRRKFHRPAGASAGDEASARAAHRPPTPGANSRRTANKRAVCHDRF